LVEIASFHPADFDRYLANFQVIKEKLDLETSPNCWWEQKGKTLIYNDQEPRGAKIDNLPRNHFVSSAP
jgi:hypothetical protein